jgi:uncharacterized protein (DUF1330 family)
MDAAGPIPPKYNGKVIVFNLDAKKVEGSPKTVMAVAEFPSLADAERFYTRRNIQRRESFASRRLKVRS